MANAIKAYPGQGLSVIYEYDDGRVERWEGGTRSWRNNNPGNIRGGPFTDTHGAIGDAFGFACFSSKDAGVEAIVSLLSTPKYQSLNLGEAIYRYAPPIENDTEAYIASVKKDTGLSRSTPMSRLTHDELKKVVLAIIKKEVYVEGKIFFLQGNDVNISGKYVWRTAKDEKVRAEHGVRDGKVFSWSDKPKGGHVGRAINCRCWADPVYESKLKKVFPK